MHRAVVLDTNIYRQMTEESFRRLLEAERRRQVAPYADPWVIMELLAHLADSEDPDFASCRRALRRVYARCVENRNGRPGGLINDSESQITRMITGKPLAGHEETTAWLGDLCHAVAVTPEDQQLKLGEAGLRFIADHVASMEAWFAKHSREQRDRVETLLAQITESSERRLTRAAAMRELEESGVLRTALAEMIVRGAYKDVGDAVREPLDPRVVEQVRKTVAVGIEFHARLLRKVIYEGADLEKSRTLNLLWDQRISYCIGQTLGAGPIWFVTNDRAFAAAAQAVGYEKRVRSLVDYERWLNAKRRGLNRPRKRGGRRR